MPNNTYKGDVGIKLNFVKNHNKTEEPNTDDIFADDLSDVDDDKIYDEHFSEDIDEPGHFHIESEDPSEQGFSVLSESERKYAWEKSVFDDDKSIGTVPKSRKAQKEYRRNPESNDDENYDFEIGNNAAGLKILMGLMLITFIVIISVLVYKLTVLTEDYQSVLAKLEEAPTEQELKSLEDDILAKEQSIKQLTNELSQYKVVNALAGDLIETPEGFVYIVAAGDTLGKIAQEYDVSINQIMQWNELDNADSIKVDQRLIVRKLDEQEEAAVTVD